MNRHLNRLSTGLVRAGLATTLLTIVAAFTPGEAEASIVCGPGGSPCYSNPWDCDTLRSPPSTISSGWSCKDKLVVNPRSRALIIRERDGRAAILANGERIYILSDAVVARFTRSRPSAEEFARLVLADRGSVSDQSLQAVSRELGIPIASRPRERR